MKKVKKFRKKYNLGGEATKGPKLGRKPRMVSPRKKSSKNVNTPGEGQRAFQGKIDLMISKAEGDFNKMIKNFRAKTRS
jgi:hypothetical protein